MQYNRPRRNRKSKVIRSLVRETELTSKDLVQPFFVMDGKNKRESIDSIPGNERLSIDELLKDIKLCIDSGLRSFILFPVVNNELKDPEGSYSFNPSNFYLKAIKEIKEKSKYCKVDFTKE
ncbi:MAG: porphobilinogen synthase, partial [Flavobacteriales bacterium]